MAVALQTKRWTLRDLHVLPEDGNKYELIDGELFVTPPPTDEHETIAARLTRILDPYVSAQRLGLVFHPRAVLRHRGSEAEPDLMVRAAHPRRTGRDRDWSRAPTPILVVEIASPYTRRRDRDQKRDYYLRAGVAEYWMVDAEERTITIVRPDRHDETVADRLTWRPRGASEPLVVALVDVFGDASAPGQPS